MLRMLSLLIFSFWTTTLSAGEFVLLPEGEPACYSLAKMKTALKKDNITIEDCGQIPNSLHVKVVDAGTFSAGGREFQLKKFAFLQLLQDGTIENVYLYGFMEISPPTDLQVSSTSNDE